MELLIIVVVVLIIIQVLVSNNDEKNFSGGLKDCRTLGEPHKWSYNRNDKLECTECSFVAGREEPSHE